MKCPKCGCDNFNVYSTSSETDENGKITVIQHRKCKDCGITGKTTYDKQFWICELNPEDYFT